MGDWRRAWVEARAAAALEKTARSMNTVATDGSLLARAPAAVLWLALVLDFVVVSAEASLALAPVATAVSLLALAPAAASWLALAPAAAAA